MSLSQQASEWCRRTVDGRMGALLGLVGKLPAVDPVITFLGPHRLKVAHAVAAAYRPRLEPLFPGVIHHNPEAIGRYNRLLSEALHTMRTAKPGGWRAWLDYTDTLIYKDSQEILDDPLFPQEKRVHTLALLDRFNAQIGAYKGWIHALERLVQRAEASKAGPVRVMDLAAGHAGFSLELKRHFGERIDMVATDVRPEYLQIGKEQAQTEHLPMRFATQDATDLSNVHHGQIDIFLCTLTIHHFAPGMVARLLGEATRKARVGVCLIDGERGLVPLLFTALVMPLFARSWPMWHDGVVSIRRMYVEEELALIAALAPFDTKPISIQSIKISPAYTCLQVWNIE